MRSAITVWLACVLLAGMFFSMNLTSAKAGTPGQGDNGILQTHWVKDFDPSYNRIISTSAGLVRAEESCNLDVVIGGEEFNDPGPPKGLWHSVRANGIYRWLKDTESDEASSSVAIADLDGDGIDEVVGGTTSGKTLEVLSATTGNFVWTFPNPPISSDYLYEWHSSPAVAEIDDSIGGLEVIALHAYSSTIYSFQGDNSDGLD